MLNHDFINKAYFEVEKNLKLLRKRKGVTAQQLETDTELLWLVAHGLQLTVQALIDIGTHILSEIGSDRWEKYAEIPHLLNRHNVLSDQLAQSFVEMIKTRNVLANEYLFLDAEKIVKVMNNNLDDIQK